MSEGNGIVLQAAEDVALLSLADVPQNAIKQASQAATAIMGVIESKPKVVTFNSEIYFENEDWVFIGKFYGVTVRIVKDEYVEFGTVKGFQAEAEAVLSSTGQIVGRAFMMCLDDEENWGAVPKYEWQDELDDKGQKIWEEKIIKGKKKNLPRSKKVKVGEVKKPLFQLRSMAQTRASSKVLSMIFKFIPVLASKGGKRVSATPAEEASEDFTNTNTDPREQNEQPTRAKRKEPSEPAEPILPQDPDCITKEQVLNLWKIATGVAKFSQDEVRVAIAEYKGKDGKPLQHTRDMLKKDYDKFMSSLPNVKWNFQDEPGANG